VNTETPATSEEIDQPPLAVTLSNNVRDTSPLFDTVQSVDFHWDPIFVGHCQLAATTLSVFSDGTARWLALDVYSTAGDDSVLATFEFFDPHGISLWRFGHISSPSLSPPFAIHEWVDNTSLLFPAYIFPFIASVNLQSHA
jgi:hypothetical protein